MAKRFTFQDPQSQRQTNFGGMQPQHPSVRFPEEGMWAQQHRGASQQLPDDHTQKRHEYFKQQQKLRLLTATSHKSSVSADTLIENLLGKKDTFKPKSTLPSQPCSTTFTSKPVSGGTGSRQSGGFAVPSITAGAMSEYSATRALYMHGQTPPVLAGGPRLPQFSAAPDASYAGAQAANAENIILPPWLMPSSPSLPAVYRQVWSMVGQTEGLVDTTRIFPLLLTSGLPNGVLGFIWSLANQTVAGQLTEQELYIVLALVALAQTGCSFNNLGILSIVAQAPVPRLNLRTHDTSNIQASGSHSAPSHLNTKMRREDLNLQALDCPVSDNVTANEPFDDFTDFQSAVSVPSENKLNTFVPEIVDSPTEDPSSPTQDTLQQKFPSVMVVTNTSHGRGIGSRLANHSLGAPKHLKTRHSKHQHHSEKNHQQTNSNLVTPVEDDFTDFQQASIHVQSGGSNAQMMFPKCTMKPIHGKTFLLKESAIRSETIPDLKADSLAEKKVEGIKDEATCSESVVQTSEVTSVESSQETSEIHGVCSDGDTEMPNILEPACGKEVDSTKETGDKELMSVEEDKYSALRVLSLVSQQPTEPEEKGPACSSGDDFDDFISADDSFADIASRNVQSVAKTSVTSPVSTSFWQTLGTTNSAEFQVDDWNPFGSSKEPGPAEDEWSSFAQADITDVQPCGLDTGSSDIIGQMKVLNIGEKGTDIHLFDSSTNDKSLFGNESSSPLNLDLNSEWNTGISVTSATLPGRTSSTADDSQDSAGFQGFLGKIYNDKVKLGGVSTYSVEETNTQNTENTYTDSNDDEFGEFVGPDTWPDDNSKFSTSKDLFGMGTKESLFYDSQSVSSLELPPLALSRHGSVPSLDLNLFPSQEKVIAGLFDTSLPQGSEHQVTEWARCLESCLELLQAALATFQAVSSEEVLLEVLEAREGCDYLHDLLEVFGVCQRVETSYKQHYSDSKVDSLLSSLHSIWSSLQQFYRKANIPVKANQDAASALLDSVQDVSACGVCLTLVNGDVKVDSDTRENTSHLEYGGHVYHAVCANLWVNCVDCSLPALTITTALL